MTDNLEAALFLVTVVIFFGVRWWLQRLRRERDEAKRQAAVTANELQALLAKQEAGRQNSIKRSENQISAVTDPDVSMYTKPVMNGGEYQVYLAAKRALKELGRSDWHVFPQVSLGEIIKTSSHYEWKSGQAHKSINSKRCDLLIANSRGKPMAVIEFQGSGHYQGNALDRDLVKKIAVERAGMLHIEIPDRLGQHQVAQLISEALRAG
jgi:hypothetical protein